MEQNKELVKALIEVQRELGPVAKDATNPAFHAQYATIAAILEHITPVLTKNGFALSQQTGFTGEKFVLFSQLLHKDGGMLQSVYWINPAQPNNPQHLAAAVTYARKASMGIIGLTAVDDDDGNMASKPEKKPVDYSKPASTAAKSDPAESDPAESDPAESDDPYISEPQAKRFFAIWKSTNKTQDQVKNYLNATFKINTSGSLKRSQYNAACKWAAEPAL